MSRVKALPGLVLLFALVACYGLWSSRLSLETSLVQTLTNWALKDTFNGSFKVSSAYFDPQFKLQARGLSGEMKAKTGPVLVHMDRFSSTSNLLLLLLGKPAHMSFEGMRLAQSKEMGIAGTFTFIPGKVPQVTNRGNIQGIDLRDLEWADPKNLKGANGVLSGTYVIASRGNTIEQFEIKVTTQGGHLQAKFFNLLTQYLPQLKTNIQMQQLIQKNAVIPFQAASLDLKLENMSTMKVLLKILVKDYNLQLNLNIEIRLDEENAFFEAAQILGLLEISAG